MTDTKIVQPEFYLTAMGGVTFPSIHHAIIETATDSVMKEATKVVAQLSKAGYFNFWLVDAKTNETIKRFRVEQPEPVVTVWGE